MGIDTRWAKKVEACQTKMHEIFFRKRKQVSYCTKIKKSEKYYRGIKKSPAENFPTSKKW